MIENIIVTTITTGRAAVRDRSTGRELGELRREWVGFQPRAGQMDAHRQWFAVPMSRIAHANPDGCPWFPTRREAAEALHAGVTLG